MLVAGIVIVHALAQGLTVLGDPVPVASVGFVASAVLSLVVLAAAAWAAATIILRARWHASGLVWMLGLVVLATALSLVSPFLPPVALLLGLLVVPSVISGTGPLGGFRAFRAHPVRHSFGLLGAIALIVVGWVAALLLGLLVTGFAAAVATWLVFGFLGALVIAGWRERPARAVVP
jgi:uncharacterized membrane protein